MLSLQSVKNLSLAIAVVAMAGCTEQAKNNRERHEDMADGSAQKKSKVLFVLTNVNSIEKSGERTGYTLTEAAQPWLAITKAGYDVDFMSPKGGEPTVDTLKFDNQGDRIFWNDQGVQTKLKNTLKPADVKLVDYMAVLYVGGHGTMFDFRTNPDLNKLAADMYEKGGIVAAVCHGPAALIDVKLSTGQYLIEGKNVTGFTNSEEKEVKKDAVMPYLLETELTKRNARFVGKPNWEPNVQVAERLVTGQNPQSAAGVGDAIVKLLDQISAR